MLVEVPQVEVACIGHARNFSNPEVMGRRQVLPRRRRRRRRAGAGKQSSTTTATITRTLSQTANALHVLVHAALAPGNNATAMLWLDSLGLRQSASECG